MVVPMEHAHTSRRISRSARGTQTLLATLIFTAAIAACSAADLPDVGIGSSTTPSPVSSSNALGPTLLELGMNNLGVEITEEDWLAATSQLCADQIRLFDAAREFKDRHDLARSDSEIISALRDASSTQCPGNTFR